MKKVALVFNGGTISMKIDEKINAAVPGLSGEEILSMVTGADEFADIESYSFSEKPSPHISIEDMFRLSNFINELVNREDIDGVVLTHGTDTLEETAYFLDLTINTEKVIVVTGAMRSSSELGYDGPFNLATSICTAISEEAKGRGVLVCFNGELHCASEVTKANSMALNAFRTPNFGPIGIVDNNQVVFHRKTRKHKTYKLDKIIGDVALIKCVSGMNSDFVEFAIDKGYKGIVIEALGRGNVPPLMLPGIKKALKKEIPVIVVSRCFEGRVREAYGYEGGGKMLKDLGVFFEEDMPGQKARIKLLVVLSSKENLNLNEAFNEV
ncbi:asparaginase [Clostridium isatidis]|uniref:L-asparaginase n=1 Tax=Clostridium isatidis TaxID=182773 RepID=A0A343JBS0_9CLOT|nr:asparaginase [Clostridium isatidis]ASW42978.1 L-asparaginase [Clostridium isatidis]NLZ35131.1 asparaginase [Clostridiales bacterium]